MQTTEATTRPTDDPPQLIYARHDIAVMFQPATGIVIAAAVGTLAAADRKARDAAASFALQSFFQTPEHQELNEKTLHKLAGRVRAEWNRL